MSEPHIVVVTSCPHCPFEYDGTCMHPVVEDDVTQTDNDVSAKPTWYEDPPPAWCPLRLQRAVVRLSEGR